ncbi:response regulator transcription factor [Bacillus infantis]|uniref:Response regulator transcription factor n=1 Tax=Bacillus infantis TaxID=324767 RepID=A0A5D4RM96_9BACI|nr:response regulator transcription factor [Bacillus infantis]TYS50914.1 response regulator transcription factor [Bacillus infantis]
MQKIMIIEDDSKMRGLIGQFLKNWGFSVPPVDDFSMIAEQFSACSPDLVLLDINLPERDGYYWCGRIREMSDVPVIFISSRSQNMDIIMAMNMGGDDYIQKPFSLEVLVAKINAVLRRAGRGKGDEKETDLITAGPISLSLGTAAFIYEGTEVSLTKNEFLILYTLMKKPEQIVSRDEIMRALWQDEQFIDDNTLTVNVGRLRKKLESAGLKDRISTKKGLGYMLL